MRLSSCNERIAANRDDSQWLNHDGSPLRRSPPVHVQQRQTGHAAAAIPAPIRPTPACSWG
ncbi:hypothetical protein P1U19_21270 [Escherichia coli]